MHNKCSIIGCSSNYESELKKGKDRVTIYSFPKDTVERSAWIRSIPQVFSKITPHMGVCRLHWPDEFPMYKKGRYLSPAVPPSIFSADIPATCYPTPVDPPRVTLNSTTDVRDRAGDVTLDRKVIDNPLTSNVPHV